MALLAIIIVGLLFAGFYLLLRDQELIKVNNALKKFEKRNQRKKGYKALTNVYYYKDILLLPETPRELEELARTDPDRKRMYFDTRTGRVVRRPLAVIEKLPIGGSFSGWWE